MSLETTLAARFLFHKRRRRFLSVASLVAVLGLSFGVASLLVALSVVTGFQREYKKSILGFNSHLVLMKSDEIANPDEIAAQLSAYEAKQPEGGKIVGWTPFIYREGMVVSGSKVKGIVFKGVDYDRYARLSHMEIRYQKTPPPPGEENLPEIVLGKTLFEELGLKDDVLRVLFPQGLKPEEVGAKNVKKFRVVGTFESGLYEYDSSFAFMSLPVAEKFFDTDGKVSGLEIWLQDPDRAEAWAAALRPDFEYPYAVMTWRELNENVFRALGMEKLLFTILMTVLIAVSVLNILGTLMMLLLEKRAEVGVLRTLGLSWKRLRKIFILDGLLIGSVGILLGLGLGMGVLFFLETWHPIHLAPEVYFIKNVPVTWSWGIFGWVVGSSFLIILASCEIALRRITHVNVTRALLEA